MNCSSRSVGAPLFEKNNPMPGSRPQHAKAERPRWIQKPLSASSRAGFPRCRDWRLGRRPRGLQETVGRAACGEWHGLHTRPAPRPEPRQHDGGSARGPHLDAGRASDRRNGDRTRARLCHSAWRLSFRRQRGVADFATARASRRAPPIRLPVEFAGARIWRARRLRGPLGNRRRRQRRPNGGKGERRPRHRAGARRSRL